MKLDDYPNLQQGANRLTITIELVARSGNEVGSHSMQKSRVLSMIKETKLPATLTVTNDAAPFGMGRYIL